MKYFKLLFLFVILASACQEQGDKKNAFVAVEKIVTKDASYKLGPDGLEAMIKKTMYIPLLAQQYGIDATTSIELTIDTSGQVVSVRVANESPEITDETRKVYPNIDNKISGLFAIEAERIGWITNNLWNPALENNKPVASTIYLSFEFKTDQAKANKERKEKGEPFKFKEFTEGQKDLGPKLYFQIGSALMRQHYFNQSIRFFNASTYLDDTHIDAYFNKGIAFNQLGNRKEACLNWQIASKLGDEEATKLLKQNCE